MILFYIKPVRDRFTDQALDPNLPDPLASFTFYQCLRLISLSFQPDIKNSAFSIQCPGIRPFILAQHDSSGVSLTICTYLS